MFNSYVKIALRNIRRHKWFSAINIAGLTLGFAVSIILTLYVVDDLSFDRFHEHSENIYRVTSIESSPGKANSLYAITSGPFVSSLNEEIPGIISATRFITRISNVSRQGEEENSVRARLLITEPNFFDVFSFKLLKGEPGLLHNPNAVLITPRIAEAVFGSEDPMGKPIETNFIEDGYVAGIVEEPPYNSHIQFDILAPLIISRVPRAWNNWRIIMFSGYIRVNETADIKAIKQKMEEVAFANNLTEIITPDLQPFLDVHLGSSDYMYDFRNLNKNDSTIVLAFAVIAILVISMATLNFVNLTSARAATRAKEVGLRKVVGSSRVQLISQFLCESIIMSAASMVIAVGLIELALPEIESFLDKPLGFNIMDFSLLLPLLATITVIIGIIAGLYPAFIISSYQPVKIVRGELLKGKRGSKLRASMVVFQFSITIALIISILTVLNQIEYLQAKDNGFNRERTMVIEGAFNEKDDLFKEKLASLPAIEAVGGINQLPGTVFSRWEVSFEGNNSGELTMLIRLLVDDTFLPAMEIGMAEGRNFSRTFLADTINSIIINEAAANIAGWEEPIGKRIFMENQEGVIETYSVVGIINDIHYTTMKQEVEPIMMLYRPRSAGMVLARLRNNNEITTTREQIEKIYNEIYFGQQFNPVFLDDVFNEQFESDRNFATHMSLFAVIAIIIACLGMLGLISFNVEQRLKEIAVRKVLGATEAGIVTSLQKDIVLLVLLANVFAWPLAYYGMQKWLEGFAFRGPMELITFLSAGFMAIIIAIATVSFHSYRAATTNPADILQQE